MPERFDLILTPRVRAWIYRVGLALVAVLGVYSIIDENQAAAWIALLTALVGQSVAAAHTPTSGD